MSPTQNRLVLIDTNVFIYAAGKPDAFKVPSQRVLALASAHEQFFTNAEVFQELLHHYLSRRIWSQTRAIFEDFASLMAGRIESIEMSDVQVAVETSGRWQGLSARDLVHVAVAQRVGARYIVTADKGFGGVEGIERLDPMRVEEWRSLMEQAWS